MIEFVFIRKFRPKQYFVKRLQDAGCVTLSEISPVKRSSMLPPSHLITLIASPSSSTLSVTSEFTKPASAR
jgi:hypothetical protein